MDGRAWFHLLVGALTLGCVYGQAQITTINLATQSRNPDFSSFPFTRPVTVGTTLPTTCQVGQLFFNTNVAAGSNLYGCTAANTWTTLSNSSASTPQVTLTPTSVTFTTQTIGTSSGGTTITLLNSGTSYLTLSSITMSGANAADFLASNTCGTTVPSGAS
ncbi:MAG TPA: hypothetical protein VHZ55_11980, partial [Bryobacteraceae bacterium]|nr:hypothetical protein [Bryobacteraceae bacterium]